MAENHLIPHNPHWFERKALQFSPMGRRPQTATEWARCLYNADIFIGHVPFLKCVAIVSWLIAWVAASLIT